MPLFGSREEERPVEERIREWLSDEQAKFERLPPQPNAEFALLVDYPPSHPAGKIQILRPANRKLVVLGMGVQLAPPHLSALSALPPPGRERVIRTLRKTAFSGGMVGFGPQMENGIPVRWTLDVLLFDDGLTRHNLHASLRALFTKHLELIETLNLELGVSTAAPPPSPATGLAGYM